MNQSTRSVGFKMCRRTCVKRSLKPVVMTSSSSSGLYPSLQITSPFKEIISYTPKGIQDNIIGGVVSTVIDKNASKCKVSIDAKVAVIPANSIIDSIEFFGHNGFATKGTFNIGIGAFNSAIKMPLIEKATSDIANERVGGCRNFLGTKSTGQVNDLKSVIPVASYINVASEEPITNGYLHIRVVYHHKY